MATTIKPARANLHAALAAHTPFTGDDVQVTFGLPADHEEQEVVALGGIEDPDEEDAALGAQRKEEAYVLLVLIKAHDPTGDAVSVDGRGFDLADEVRAVVHADRTLGGAVRDASATGTRTDGARAAEGGGWVIFLTVAITCRARIT